MEKEIPNYYSIIPANVRYDKRLKPNEKLLYGEITALSNKNGYCFATNKYFASLYNVSIKTISLWINELKEYGYINIDFIYKENSKEIMYRKISIDLSIKKEIPIEEKKDTSIEEKVKDNSTSTIILNNNINNKKKKLDNNNKLLLSNKEKEENYNELEDKFYNMDFIKFLDEFKNYTYSLKDKFISKHKDLEEHKYNSLVAQLSTKELRERVIDKAAAGVQDFLEEENNCKIIKGEAINLYDNIKNFINNKLNLINNSDDYFKIIERFNNVFEFLEDKNNKYRPIINNVYDFVNKFFKCEQLIEKNKENE